jgi:hypothetical protein
MRRIIPALIVAAAAMMFDPEVAGAYGAPWCAVLNYGMGSAYWDCQYSSLQACVPNVLAGNRGFCNPNPAYYGETRPLPKRYNRHRRAPY